MAHSYTPGLKVLQKTLFRKERILPLKGKVLVKKGDNLSPDTVVALSLIQISEPTRRYAISYAVF